MVSNWGKQDEVQEAARLRCHHLLIAMHAMVASVHVAHVHSAAYSTCHQNSLLQLGSIENEATLSYITISTVNLYFGANFDTYR